MGVSGTKSDGGPVNNGSVGRICPQANPGWELIAAQFIPSYLAGIPFNASSLGSPSSNSSSAPKLPPLDPRTTEDCLFLDVVVPQAIFRNACNTTNNTSGAPVLVWIYGGGYTAGDKSSSGNPAGLIKASQVTGSDGVVYVSMNYRVSAKHLLAIRYLNVSSWVPLVGCQVQLCKQTGLQTPVCMTNAWRLNGFKRTSTSSAAIRTE